MRCEVAQRSPVTPSFSSAFWTRRVGCLRGRRGRQSHSRQPTLVISHLELDINRLERWLRRLEDRHRLLDDYRRVLS